MIQAIILLSAGLISFLFHNFFEKLITANNTKSVRLIIRGYHVHHSVWGIVAIVVAIIFTGNILMLILTGYGLGNIWQHKKTHNKINEKGLVFISRIVN